jgi:hypothetical protein
MQKEPNAAPMPQQTDDKPMYIWLKRPDTDKFPPKPDNPDKYPVYPEDDGYDRPRNPYSPH